MERAYAPPVSRGRAGGLDGRAKRWAGVDVGGRRKGFHLALIEQGRLVVLEAVQAPADAARWLKERDPEVVAVDSPRRAAPDGERSREGERRLAWEVCGIRYTPDRARLSSNRTYYEWIFNGFDLYEQLELVGLSVVECFPTASWTRWGGKRSGTRAAWSTRVLSGAGLAAVPERTNQDCRDAIGAALTARAHDEGETERFGDIAVPERGRDTISRPLVAPLGRRGCPGWRSPSRSATPRHKPGTFPGFVFGIFVSLFVLFMSFAANMAFQYRRQGRWQSYLFGERVYLLLSLTAKSLLAWQIFFPTLM